MNASALFECRIIAAARWLVLLTSAVAVFTAPPVSAQAGEPRAARHLKLNTPAPDFKLFTIDKKDTVTLAAGPYVPGQRRSGRKPVLLDFFRTDCQPCKEALPQLTILHKLYANSGLRIVLIALLTDKDGRRELEQFFSRNPVPFNVVVDDTNAVAERYMGKSAPLPSTFLIDRRGILKESKHSADGELSEHFADSLTEVLHDYAEATGQ